MFCDSESSLYCISLSSQNSRNDHRVASSLSISLVGLVILKFYVTNFLEQVRAIYTSLGPKFSPGWGFHIHDGVSMSRRQFDILKVLCVSSLALSTHF